MRRDGFSPLLTIDCTEITEQGRRFPKSPQRIFFIRPRESKDPEPTAGCFHWVPAFSFSLLSSKRGKSVFPVSTFSSIIRFSSQLPSPSLTLCLPFELASEMFPSLSSSVSGNGGRLGVTRFAEELFWRQFLLRHGVNVIKGWYGREEWHSNTAGSSGGILTAGWKCDPVRQTEWGICRRWTQANG